MAPPRTLVLMRHAHALAQHPGGDRQRPLSEVGHSQATQLAEWLSSVQVRPDVALVSDATRTRETAETLQRADVVEQLWPDRSLYLAAPETILRQVSEIPDSVTVAAVVAHAPGIPDTARVLASQDVDTCEQKWDWAAWPEAAAAVFTVPEAWDQTPWAAVQLAHTWRIPGM